MSIRLIQGDCLQVLPSLGDVKAIFADPPDNLGLQYDSYIDQLPPARYFGWLDKVVRCSLRSCQVFWFSYYHRHDVQVKMLVNAALAGYPEWEARTFIWRYTFGQYREEDCASGYRPILRLKHRDAQLYPDSIRVTSRRQELGDKRSAGPRVPDDVWEFPRVVGNAKERRPWHPTQHPEALMERIIRFSCAGNEQFVDLFSGTGTSLRVAQKLGTPCTGIELSSAYCERIADELKITVAKAA